VFGVFILLESMSGSPISYREQKEKIVKDLQREGKDGWNVETVGTVLIRNNLLLLKLQD
jgi:hypothetical protein